DDGAEPSTHPYFYVTPDVWNRRGPTDGSPFPNDQPANEDAGNGAGNLGDNWAFARIRRNASGVADTVTVHYAVSPFGTGSAYADNVVPFPGLTMAGPDPTVPFLAPDLGPITTANYPWHLDAIASTHLCLAAQISTASDPYLQPGIVGHTPGWGTGTDLEILNDNNKAQRNMGLSTTPSHGGPSKGSVSYTALIHNAATFTRDVPIRFDGSREAIDRFGNQVTLEVVGGERIPFQSGSTFNIPRMRPGENRWIKLTLPAVAISDGETLPVYFYELKDGEVVNGFSIGIRGTKPSGVLQGAVRNHLSSVGRLAALYGSESARREAEAAVDALRIEAEAEFVDFYRRRLADIGGALSDLDRIAGTADPFDTHGHFDQLSAALGKGDATGVALALGSLANTVDSRIT